VRFTVVAPFCWSVSTSVLLPPEKLQPQSKTLTAISTIGAPKMPGMSSESGGGELVLFSTKEKTPVLYPLSYGLKSPVHRLSISWGCGNNLRVTVLRNPELRDDDDGEVGGKVVNVRLSGEDGEISDPQWRRIAYGSVSPFALLQSRRNSISSLSKMDMSSSLYQTAW